MSSQQAAITNAEVSHICINVSHASRKHQITVPSATTTVGDLKEEIEQSLGVPLERQRLLFDTHVLRQYRSGAADDVRLIDIVAKPSKCPNSGPNRAQQSRTSGTSNETTECKNNCSAIVDRNGDGVGGGDGEAVRPPHTVITIPVMLLGTAATAPQVDEEVTAQLHRLVTSTVELDSRWYRCSYGKGYARQTAFVCRTCVNNGTAAPAHAVCYACAEVCHNGHDVEEWGVRYFMRCDCCTPVCWRDPESGDDVGECCDKGDASGGGNGETQQGRKEKEKDTKSNPQGILPLVKKAEECRVGRRCCFIVDNETGEPPVSKEVIPPNSRNVYPRSSQTWCYCRCEDDHPADGSSESAGVVCMLCTTCFWSAHITRLYTDMLGQLPCYEELVEGDVVAFYCESCASVVCGPCRLRCHGDHGARKEVAVEPHEQNERGPIVSPQECTFKCGCSCCSTGKSSKDAVVSGKGIFPIPPDTAADIMNNDSFIGFICAHCMQEHPWLMTGNFRACYGGQLPPPVPQELHKPIVPCSFPADAACSKDTYPFHGMLFSVDAFTEDMTCKCAPCRQAYERFAPRTNVTAQDDMAVQLHDTCDHCGKNIRDERAFMCQTCETQDDKAYFVCERCNSYRLGAILPVPNTLSTRSEPANVSESVTECPTTQEDEPSAWDHPIDHIFLEDTCENLLDMCGMCISQYLDPQARDSVLEEARAGQGTLAGILQQTFGEVPLTFDSRDVTQHQKTLQQQKKKRKVQTDTPLPIQGSGGTEMRATAPAVGCKRTREATTEGGDNTCSNEGNGNAARDGDSQV